MTTQASWCSSNVLLTFPTPCLFIADSPAGNGFPWDITWISPALPPSLYSDVSFSGSLPLILLTISASSLNSPFCFFCFLSLSPAYFTMKYTMYFICFFCHLPPKCKLHKGRIGTDLWSDEAAVKCALGSWVWVGRALGKGISASAEMLLAFLSQGAPEPSTWDQAGLDSRCYHWSPWLREVKRLLFNSPGMP